MASHGRKAIEPAIGKRLKKEEKSARCYHRRHPEL